MYELMSRHFVETQHRSHQSHKSSDNVTLHTSKCCIHQPLLLLPNTTLSIVQHVRSPHPPNHARSFPISALRFHITIFIATTHPLLIHPTHQHRARRKPRTTSSPTRTEPPIRTTQNIELSIAASPPIRASAGIRHMCAMNQRLKTQTIVHSKQIKTLLVLNVFGILSRDITPRQSRSWRTHNS
jgi:hypothetical protein